MSLDENDKLRLQHIEMMMIAQLRAMDTIIAIFAAVTNDEWAVNEARKLRKLWESCDQQMRMMPDWLGQGEKKQ